MKYRYTGPMSGVTLNEGQEVMLFPNTEVELPEDHEYTQTLLALGHLTPLPVTTTKGKKGESDGR